MDAVVVNNMTSHFSLNSIFLVRLSNLFWLGIIKKELQMKQFHKGISISREFFVISWGTDEYTPRIMFILTLLSYLYPTIFCVHTSNLWKLPSLFTIQIQVNLYLICIMCVYIENKTKGNSNSCKYYLFILFSFFHVDF